MPMYPTQNPETPSPVIPAQSQMDHGAEPVTTPGPREVTIAGVTIPVSPDVFDDFEFIESLDRIQRGDILVLPSIFRTVTGGQADVLLNALRDPSTGRVTASAATDTILEIMQAVSPKA